MNQNGMKTKPAIRLWISAVALTLAFLLTACGSGKDTAASIRLVRTDGTVRVDNAEGKSVKVTENLGLYSGYELTTRAESYGWITLDDSKLAKMDEESDVEIRKKNKLLELYVRSGALFFNVTEPLAEDETMDIRTSTMAIGIRGTCGWVEVADADLMCVYLLRGKVECTVYGRDGTVLATETITAGQAAKMTRDGDGASITVAAFRTDNTPDFVTEALNHPEHWPQNQTPDSGRDQPLFDDSLDMSGETDGERNSDAAQGTDAWDTPDISGTEASAGSTTQETAEALEHYRSIIDQADSYSYDSTAITSAEDIFQYALVQMQTQNTVPALLLKRSYAYAPAASHSILVFQYNPDTGEIIQASGTLSSGRRNDLYMAGDGNGVLALYGTSDIGYTMVQRISLNGTSLYTETLWEVDDNDSEFPIERIGILSIDWYQITDNRGLDN